MAEAAHNAWLKKRDEEKGWHHPNDCRAKEKYRPCPECHACMVPFDQVPDKDKELPRSYPAVFLKVLDEMGYDIVKRPRGFGSGNRARPGEGPQHHTMRMIYEEAEDAKRPDND